MATSHAIHGLLAEFEDPTSLVAAAHESYAHGYRCMDAYSPFPIEELHEALGTHHTRLPLIVLVGGVVGGVGGYLLQFWANALAYPLNVGGKPLHSWPAFIPVTFECTILGAALAAVFGMLALNGLPQPYHPVFNVRSEEHTSELQSLRHLVCRLLLEKKKNNLALFCDPRLGKGADNLAAQNGADTGQSSGATPTSNTRGARTHRGPKRDTRPAENDPH